MLNDLYGAIARRRRLWYAAHPEARRRLERPTISIGNLVVGGSGKTPAVAYVARLLRDLGERPAVLSRGYARAQPDDGVVVVRDPWRLRADVPRSGDEPMMLAFQLPGVAVLVSSDRYLAGRLAELQFGCTVHVLDDGFQHLRLERDVDLLLMAARELNDPRTLPFGRLREPLDDAAAADAVVLTEPAPETEALVRRLGVGRVFQAERWVGEPRDLSGVPVERTTPVLAVAGIARPERFGADLRAAGWTVAGERLFGDHHQYSVRDRVRIAEAARSAGAGAVLTTEKDVVRLLLLRPLPFRLAAVPLTVTIQPEAEFRAWLVERLQSARSAARPPRRPAA